MYALVANGIATVCSNHRQLQALAALYPYPKFQKCSTAEEARRWLRLHARGIKSVDFDNYGDTATTGYVTVRYKIVPEGIVYDLDTHLAGYIKVHPVDGALVCGSMDTIHIEVSDVELNNALIVHHLLAVKRILRMLGGFVDINLVVPDISIYLAIKQYSGKNYVIKGLQQTIAQRLGAVSITIREEEVYGSTGEVGEQISKADGNSFRTGASKG